MKSLGTSPNNSNIILLFGIKQINLPFLWVPTRFTPQIAGGLRQTWAGIFPGSLPACLPVEPAQLYQFRPISFPSDRCMQMRQFSTWRVCGERDSAASTLKLGLGSCLLRALCFLQIARKENWNSNQDFDGSLTFHLCWASFSHFASSLMDGIIINTLIALV